MWVSDADRSERTERGAVLPLMAIVLVVLLGTAAMAVDLGWLLWQSIEIQHGADAAALAGVVYEPDLRTEAHTEAAASAITNGYDDLLPSTTVSVIDSIDDNTAVDHDGQLRVTITHRVDTFFLKIFGLNDMAIARTAVAEYVQPLAMGSPESYFGNDPELGNDPGFWGNIHGYYTGRSLGDRYASQCLETWQGPSCTPNPEVRVSLNAGTIDASGGYLYGVEVEPGATGLTVEIFDGPFTAGGNDPYFTGDKGRLGCGKNNLVICPVTYFMLYGPDPTPLDTRDGNELLCVVRYDPRLPYFVNQTDTWAEVDATYPGGLAALWDSMCPGGLDRGPGVYPLRVMVEAGDTQGLNRWSLRTSASGPQPRIYGLGDMAIYANVDGTAGDTEFFLAEVAQVHAGRTLVIELWDAGDASGDHSVSILDPDLNVPPCDWSATTGDSGSPAFCDIDTSKPGGGAKFNDHLVTIRIAIPPDYTCGDDGDGDSDDCWWKIHYNYSGVTIDTTTWSARIEGNPIRIVE